LREDVSEKVVLKVVDADNTQAAVSSECARSSTPPAVEKENTVFVRIRIDYMRGAFATATTLIVVVPLVIAFIFSAIPAFYYIDFDPSFFRMLFRVWGVAYFAYVVLFGALAIAYSSKEPQYRREEHFEGTTQAVYESCLKHVPHKSIRRIDEANHEITYSAGCKETVTLQVSPSDKGGATVTIIRSFDKMWPTLFYQEESRLFREASNLRTDRHLSGVLQKIRKGVSEFEGVTTRSGNGFAPMLVERPEKVTPRWKSVAGGIGLTATCWVLMFCSSFDSSLPYMARKDPQTALRLSNMRLALGQSNFATQARGLANLMMLNAAAAESDFRKAGPDMYDGLLASLVMQKKFDEAEDVVDEAQQYFEGQQLKPKKLRSRLSGCAASLSWIAAADNDTDEAMTQANRAVQLSPNNAYAYIARGYAYHRAGDNERALADYSTAIAFSKKIALSYQLRSQVFKDLGQLERASDDHAAAMSHHFHRSDLGLPLDFDEYGEPPGTTPKPTPQAMQESEHTVSAS
jgi:hypothetical protein